jgi:hypothetical protein
MSDDVDRRLQQRLARLAAAVPSRSLAATRPIERRPVAGATWAGSSGLVALATLALVAVVIGLRGGLTGPAASPSRVTGESPVVAQTRVSDFVLTLTVPKATWSSDEVIAATASLKYTGSVTRTLGGAGNGLFAFGVSDSSRSRRVDPIWEQSCKVVTASPGQVWTRVFYKSGAAYSSFGAQFLSDPQFHLPAGTWTITAYVQEDGCSLATADDVSLSAAVTIDVTDSTSSQLPALTTYQGAGLAFDYPSDWSVLSSGVVEHYDLFGPVVGTGGWQLPCDSAGCGPVTWSIPTDGVVVEFSTSALPQAEQSPPPDTQLTIGGLPFAETDSPTATIWTLYVPGTTVGSVTYAPQVWQIEARFGANASAATRSEVLDLVRSIRTDASTLNPTEIPSPIPSPTPMASPNPADASAARGLATRFLDAFVTEHWSTAYALLDPESQAEWGGSLAAFKANWPHPAKDTGGHYTIEDQIFDPREAAGYADGQMSAADLSRSFIFDVSFPNPLGLVPGPGMLLVAAPEGETWHLWRLR